MQTRTFVWKALFSSSLAEGEATKSTNNMGGKKCDGMNQSGESFVRQAEADTLPAAPFPRQSGWISMIIILIVYKGEMFQFNALLVLQAMHLIRR